MSAERIRQLEHFAIERLPALQLADGVFCRELAPPARPQGRSLRYTLIVWLGLLRAEAHDIDHPFHLGALRAKVLAELGGAELYPGDVGVALWAESRARGDAADELISRLARTLPRRGGLDQVNTLDVAWLVIGLAETVARGHSERGEPILADARLQLLDERRADSGLVAHRARGPRRRFPSFADEIFAVLAFAALARAREDHRAREAARQVGDRLLETQLENGGWPWVLDAKRGTVVEPYEIYSANQVAVAPIALNSLSHVTEDPRYGAAAARGIDWAFGANELEAVMLDLEARMLYHSIRRRQQLDRAYLYGKAATSYFKAPKIADPGRTLEIERSMSPDQLGWILEAWAGREEQASLA